MPHHDKFINGFRNLDKPDGIIGTVLESLAVYDHEQSSQEGLVALAFISSSYEDSVVKSIAERLPEGQSLWAFSPNFRSIEHARLRITHVPAKNGRELKLKIAGHIEREIKSQPSPGPLSPGRLPFPDQHLKFGNSDDFSPLNRGRYTVRKLISDVPYEFFVDAKPQHQKLVIFGQDALNRNYLPLPHFFRWKWAHRIPATVLVLNDPTMYLDEKLDAGWWMGTYDRDYVVEFLEIVRIFRDRLQISNEDIVFVGMSAGGISALSMASELPGAQAFIDIPRLTLQGEGALDSVVRRAVSSCLGFASAADVPDSLLYRIDVLERFKKTGVYPSFVMTQDLLDERHMTGQYGPFRERFQAMEEFDPRRHRFVEYSQWHLTKGGHFPLKETIVLEIIQKMLNDDLDFPDTLSKAEITKDSF